TSLAVTGALVASNAAVKAARTNLAVVLVMAVCPLRQVNGQSLRLGKRAVPAKYPNVIPVLVTGIQGYGSRSRWSLWTPGINPGVTGGLGARRLPTAPAPPY